MNVKLSVYFGENDRAGGRLASDALLDVFGRRGLAASLLLRGAAGFGAKHHLRTDRVLTLSDDLPLVAVAVDDERAIRAALPEVTALAGDGLITVERAAAPAARDVKLTLYAPRGAAYRDALHLLRRHGAAAAIALEGVDGTLRGDRRRARLFGGNAGVPVMIVALGGTGALPELERLLPGAVATFERIRVCKRDGVRLADPHGPADAGAAWQQLSVYAPEGARHRGHALGEQVVLRLRAAGALGATLLWGSGERPLALRRHAPLLAIAVDAPERAARWFEILDELTDEAGLLTSELVPAWRVTGGGFEHVALDWPSGEG
jgi:PII-like signaling protein